METRNSEATARTRRPVVRVFLILAALFTAWHIFATFLWIAPPSGLRELVPGQILRTYMLPMFGQSWSVFAPEPINGDYRLQVRAVVTEAGTTRTTPWVDATAAELAMGHHNLFPPRLAMQSTDLASRYKGAWDGLTGDQQAVVALGYYKGNDWPARLDNKLRSYPRPELVTAYVDIEHVMTAYATQVAYATWGNGVSQVQFVASRQNVIPYAQRDNPEAVRPPVQAAPVGWRGVVEEPGQSRSDFARTFRAGLAESGQ